MGIKGGNRKDWDAIRAEYIAGGVTQRALAARHGVSYMALVRRSADEGWVKARAEGRRAAPEDARQAASKRKARPEAALAGAKGDLERGAGTTDLCAEPEAAPAEAREDLERRAGTAGARADGGGLFGGDPAPAGGETGNAEIATRLRRKLLMRLERVADATDGEMVTEVKTQDASGTRLFKLRDLTAAYKDLAGDLAKGEEAEVEDLGILDELLR